MTETTTAPAPERAGARSPGAVRVGRTDYVIERPSARKASSAFRLLKRVSGTVKTITRELGTFEREYRKDHVLELDRIQARLRYPADPLIGSDGQPIRNPETGELVMVASRLDAMTERDWEEAGHVLRLPMAPTQAERVGAVFDLALEDAEDSLYRLLALFTLSNAEVAEARKAQNLDQVLDARADVLLDEGELTELLELAVIVGETVDDQFRSKAAELGDRMGNALRLFGLNLTKDQGTTGQAPQTAEQDTQTTGQEPTSDSASRPTSSTGSDAPTDGAPTPPSTPTTPSSSPSENGSTRSEP